MVPAESRKLAFLGQVWLEGAAAPVTFELENDELFQLFKRWIEKDGTLTASGWVGTAADKKWIINFNKVAGITTSANNERRTMGFARSVTSVPYFVTRSNRWPVKGLYATAATM